MKIKISKEMLKKEGSRILGTLITTDRQINYYGWGNPQKPLKIVVVKGYIDDWAIYIESMEETQTYEEVKDYGNEICCREKIKSLVDCSDDILARYRD